MKKTKIKYVVAIIVVSIGLFITTNLLFGNKFKDIHRKLFKAKITAKIVKMKANIKFSFIRHRSAK